MIAVDVLAVMDRQLRDRAERANRYSRKANKAAQKNGEPQITADRMAAYENLLLLELKEARAAVAELIEAAGCVADFTPESQRENWSCHNRITTAAKCGRCSRDLRLAAALARVQGGAA